MTRSPRSVGVAILSGTAIVITTAAMLAGCGTVPSSMPGVDADYTSNDGTVTVFDPGNRGDPIAFRGTTETGAIVDAEDYRGEVLVVNFWYATCPPCRREAPWLRDLAEKHASSGVQFLGVNVRDSAANSLAFTEKFEIPYPSILDEGDAAVTLAFAGIVPVSAVPSTIVFDREGRVAGRIVGIIDKSTLDAMIETVVGEEQP